MRLDTIALEYSVGAYFVWLVWALKPHEPKIVCICSSEAKADIREQGYTPATAEALYFRAHDLKGLGTTYEYPLVTRLAGSLCKMLDDADRRMSAPLVILDAHIDAIRAVVRDQIKTDEHPTGRALAETLEARVADHLAG